MSTRVGKPVLLLTGLAFLVMSFWGWGYVWRTQGRFPDMLIEHFEQGTRLARNGKTVEAARHFQKYTEIIPENARGWYNLATAHQESKEFGKALQAWNGALRWKGPHLAMIHLNRGICQFELGRQGEGKALFEQAQKSLLEAEDYGAKVDPRLWQALIREVGR